MDETTNTAVASTPYYNPRAAEEEGDASTPSSATPPTSSATPNPTPTTTPAAPRPGTSLAATDVTAQPAPAPTVVRPVRRSGLAGLVDEIRDAIAGTSTSHVYQDEQGNKYVKRESLTHGQQWARVASTALRSAAAGLKEGRGHGAGAALAAGIEQGDKLAASYKAKEQADEQEVKQDKLDHFNMVKLQHETAAADFELTRRKVKAGQDDIKFAQEQIDRERGLGSADLGVYGDAYSLADVAKQNPNFWKDVYANNIVSVPEIDPNTGERKGIHLFQRMPGIGNELVDKGTQVLSFAPPSKPGEQPKLVARTLASPATRNQVDAYNNAARKQLSDWQKEQADLADKQAQAQERKAQANHANAQAALAHAQIKQLNQASTQADIENNANQLVDGTIDPSNLSKRSKSYDATIAAANRISLTKYGTPFDLAKAAGDYKFATNPQTYNTLNYLNSLVGHDNKGGNLGVLVAMSDKLPRTEFPPLNAVDQWAKISAGNQQVAAYRAALLEVSDQIAKVLQGGGQGGGATSDAKIRQAAEILNKNFTAGQVKAIAGDTLRPLLANRKLEIIGTNRYLQQWHNGRAQTPQQQPQQGDSVTVQIPGQPPGRIPRAALEQFKKDHPNAVVQ